MRSPLILAALLVCTGCPSEKKDDSPRKRRPRAPRETAEQQQLRLQAELQNDQRFFYEHAELRLRRLRALANRLAESELKAHVLTLREFRDDFIEVDKYICSEDTGVPCGYPIRFSKRRSELAEKAWGAQAFQPFAKELFQRLRPYHPDWTEAEEARFVARTRKRLGTCFGMGSLRCDWRFTFDALNDVFAPMQKRLERAGDPGRQLQLVLVFDARGAGLASALAPTWSNDPSYTDIIQRLRRGTTRLGPGVPPVYYDVLTRHESKFIVACVPILDEKRRFAGAVMVGVRLSKDFATAEGKNLGREVGFFLDRTPLASTLPPADTRFQATAPVPGILKKHVISSDTYVAISLPLWPGDLGTRRGDNPVFTDRVIWGADYQKIRAVLAIPIPTR